MEQKTLYYGGNILTMDDHFQGQGVLTQGARILGVGELSQLKAQAGDCTMVDLKGKTLLPAFIDPHSHITSLARTVGLIHLAGAASFEELSERIQRHMTEFAPQPGEWVMGFGYDNNLMPGCRHPTRELLDRLCPDNPLLISHASGHMGVANSAALAALGITDQTPDPDGGKIGREEGTRQPNGYLEETAFTMLGSRLPQPDFAQLSKQIQMAEKTYFRYGITTIQDGLTRESEWNLLKNMDQAGALTADVVAYINMVDSQKVLEENQKYLHADGHLRIGGYKIFLDGSPQGRTAWMSKPYLGEPADYTGYPIFSDQQVKEYIRTALDQQTQLLAHCNGDAAAEQFLRCCEEVQHETGKSIASIHPVMIHAQLLRRDQVPRLVPLGMVPSFFVAHVYHWGDVHIQNFGMERAAFISPVHSAIQAGLSPTFHQDTPVIGPDMMETLWCAVNRITRDGVVLGAQERISPWEGLKAITINAARQYRQEDVKGTIAPGKKADLVILDRNPLTCPAHELKDIQVVTTIREGQVVYHA